MCGRGWDSDVAIKGLLFGVRSHNGYHTHRSKAPLPEDCLAMYGITSSPMNMTVVIASGLRHASKWRSRRAWIRGSKSDQVRLSVLYYDLHACCAINPNSALLLGSRTEFHCGELAVQESIRKSPPPVCSTIAKPPRIHCASP